MKTTIVPIIKGALGTISIGLEKYMKEIPGCAAAHVSGIQENVIVETCHISWKML